MLVYMIILCAIVVITYLIQFVVFSYSQHTVSGTDIFEMIGLPLENEFEIKQTVENN